MTLTWFDPERQPDGLHLRRGATIHHLRSTGSERASGWSNQLMGLDCVHPLMGRNRTAEEPRFASPLASQVCGGAAVNAGIPWVQYQHLGGEDQPSWQDRDLTVPALPKDPGAPAILLLSLPSRPSAKEATKTLLRALRSYTTHQLQGVS